MKRRPVRKHRADDDPRRQFLWERAAVGGGPWRALSSVYVSHRRRLGFADSEVRRLDSWVRGSESAGAGRSGAVFRVLPGRSREWRCKHDRARSSDGTLPGATEGSDRKETLKAPTRGIQPNSSGRDCDVALCFRSVVSLVEHPQRGQLSVCRKHRREILRIGGRVVSGL
jgi:hypothetical protein